MAMSGNIEDKFKDAKASLTGRIGWITRTSGIIAGAITAYNDKKTDRGAAKLEDLADTIDARLESLQQCADWINTQDGDEEENITKRVDTSFKLVQTAKENIAGCLKDHVYIETPAPARVSTDKRSIRPITDLKPDKLHLDDNPGKLHIWEENFLSYFYASNVESGELATQQNFL